VLPRNLPPNSSPLVESRPKYSNMEQCQEEAKTTFLLRNLKNRKEKYKEKR
jgi:hypothetical protein